MMDEVNSWDNEYLLNTPSPDLVGFLLAKYIIEAPCLLVDQIKTRVENVQRKFTDPAFGDTFKILHSDFRFYVPFEGDEQLFKYTPSYFNYGIRAFLERHELIYVESYPFDGTDGQALAAKQSFEAWLKSVQGQLQCMRSDLARYKQDLQQNVQGQVELRRQKALRDRDMAASLGYPLKRRDGEQARRVVPLTRRTPVVPKPLPSKDPFQPEFELDMAEYEFILSVLENMAVVVERSPQRLGVLSEETLRDIFLIMLNGYYEGGATGETFNASGKTDILIRAEKKNIFIAECKFWAGPKLMQETIDQLLGYTSWRDTKTAIVLFNRNKDFTSVLKQIPVTIHAHTNYKRLLDISGESRSRYILHQPSDANREIILTVLAFDVPVT